VQACADGGKDVTESNEDDNCLTSSGIVKVVGPPDLIVTQVTVRNAPLTVARGGSLTITAAVKNQGEGDAAASTAKYILVNTTTGATKNLNGTQGYPLLRTGSSSSLQKVVTVFADTPIGTYVVQVCADSLDVVPEGSETNNCLSTTAKVTVN
jgi:subtilase family serine protease